jgi:hypothetical protein
VRRSSTPGHFAIGVYNTPTKSKIIVAGIYGPSANDDNASFLFYQEVLDTIGELQNTFQTRSLIMAGDFNAVLTPEDSSSEHVTKRRTTGILKKILEDYHLTDIATVANNKQHTWFRRNNNRVSSRLDLILTNLPVTRPKYVTSITIFDHAWVQASFGQKREQSIPSMKDYVLGSDEFLVNFYELLERRLTTCALHNSSGESAANNQASVNRSNSRTHSGDSNTEATPAAPSGHDPEALEEDQDVDRNPMDHGLTAHDITSGRTDLHFVNDLLQELNNLHTSVEKGLRLQKQQKLI